MTADRVRRFSSVVEDDATEEHRAIWRGGLDDLRAAIRHARALGCDIGAINEATGIAPPGRFEPLSSAPRSAGVPTGMSRSPRASRTP